MSLRKFVYIKNTETILYEYDSENHPPVDETLDLIDGEVDDAFTVDQLIVSNNTVIVDPSPVPEG